MKTQFLSRNNILINDNLLFRNHPDIDGFPTGTLSIKDAFFTIDFEFHQYKDSSGKPTHITLLREFHIDSTDPSTAAFEKAALILMLKYHVFELCFEDGIPCLAITINL